MVVASLWGRQAMETKKNPRCHLYVASVCSWEREEVAPH